MSPRKNKNETTEKSETFDTILKELQKIVEKLEQADLPMEESLKTFERGVALSRQGQKILDAAEKHIELLLQDGSTKPFDTPNNS